MAKKKLTWSEELVGRKLPPEPKHIDSLMADYVKADGTFCGRMEPGDRWLRPAFTKMRKNGWVKASILSFGKGATIYFLTERGEPEALAAKDRVRAAKEARAQWSHDWKAAWQQKQEAA
jgi:DNA-binding transcriptional regulator PaaX